MAISKAEQLNGLLPKYTKAEANAYNDAEREEARIDSKPIDGEAYVLLTSSGKKMVTFTTYGVEIVSKKRARKYTDNNS